MKEKERVFYLWLFSHNDEKDGAAPFFTEWLHTPL